MQKMIRSMALAAIGVLAVAAEEYTAPDRSFTIPVPAGWRVRTAPVMGQTMTIVEPVNGGEDRVLVGGGVALTSDIRELSRQAWTLASQWLPGAQPASAPQFRVRSSGNQHEAEQTYRSPSLSAWNGFFLQGEFYFGVLAMTRPGNEAAGAAIGRTILAGARFQGIPRNPALERAIAGRWLNTDNRSSRTGVRDTLNYISNWSVIFTADGRFRSHKESWVDTHSEVYGGGNTNAAAVANGTFRIFGNVLVADIAGASGGGRQLFTVEFSPNGAGVRLNGQWFTRE